MKSSHFKKIVFSIFAFSALYLSASTVPFSTVGNTSKSSNTGSGDHWLRATIFKSGWHFVSRSKSGSVAGTWTTDTSTNKTATFNLIHKPGTFSMSISGKAEPSGGSGGGYVCSYFSVDKSVPLNYAISTPADVACGETSEPIYFTENGVPISAYWKAVIFGSSGNYGTNLASPYYFNNSTPGPYTISAKRDEATGSVSIKNIEVASVSAGTVTSTTNSPGVNETLYVARDSSAFNVTASPNPPGSWPSGYPTWKLNGTPSGTAGSSTYSFNPTAAGTYTVAAFCGSSYSKALKIVVVEVASLQYEQPSGTWNNVSGTLYVARGDSLAFKAIPNPASTWPTGQPTWGGSSGASGSGETTSVTFNTASTTSGEYKTVTATCGNTITANVVVVEVASVSAEDVTSTTDSPGASETLYIAKGASAFNVTASSSPSGSWPGGYPTWKLNGAAAGTDGSATYSFNPTTAGTYTVAASCGSSYSKALKIVVVEVASVSAEGVTSTTDTPGANETLYVARDSSTFNVTASPNPAGTWPTDFPTWKVNGTPSGTAGSATYSFDPTTAGTYTVAAFCGGSYSKAIKIVVVEVGSLQYEQPSGTWNNISGTLYVARGDSLTFKAIPNPTNTWPTGQPVWGGSSGASGTGETKSVTFNTLSTSPSDYKTVTATCGNTITANVIVVEIASVSATYSTTTVTSTTDTPGTSETLYVPRGASAFNVTASPSPSGSWPNGYPTWKLNGTAAGTDGSATYSFNPTIVGTYTVAAFCGSSYSKALKIVVVEVASVSATYNTTTITSTTDSPSANETLYVVKDSSAFNVTATPNPAGSWPSGYPTWKVNTTAAGTAGSTTYSFNPTTVGTYTVAAFCGSSYSKAIKIVVVEIEILSLEFTSDHNVICDGSTVTVAGSRYPNKEWDKTVTPNINAPITHTAGTASANKISLTVNLKVKGIPNNTAYTLTGTSTENALNFSKTGTLSIVSDASSVSLTASQALGDTIRKISQSISWKINIYSQDIDLSSTGAHTIYTTLGTPNTSAPSSSSVPNMPRMDIAIPILASAISAAGSRTNCPKIIWEIVKAEGAYYLGLSLNDNEAWTLPSTPNGADCLSISKFVRNVGMATGVPGSFSAETYAAYYRTTTTPSKPVMAIAGLSLNSPPIYPNDKGTPLTSGLNSNWSLALADANCTKYGGGASPGTVGCGPGGLNAFEAAVIYTDTSNKKWYFPGGTNYVYDNPNHIVQIFQTMPWVGAGDHDNNPSTADVLVVKAVDFTYTTQPNATL